MATAYGSSSVATAIHGGGTDSITINKPASTAEGDLLIAVCSISGDNSDFTSTGWDIVATEEPNSVSGFRILAKVAGGSEPASYDFSCTGDNNDGMTGVIVRITGNSFLGSANIIVSTDDSGTTTSHTFTPGITPSSTNSVLIMGMTAVGNVVMSGYAIANNNPTWTERQEAQESGGSTDSSIAFATATPSVASATGDFSITTNASVFGTGFLLSVEESTNVTVSPNVLTATFSVLDPTVSGGATVDIPVQSATFSVFSPTITTQQVNWAYEDRPPESDWLIESQT